jgi:Domain of unknown function (DUF4349)
MTTTLRRRLGAGLLIPAALAALTLAGCTTNTGGNQSSAPGPAAAPNDLSKQDSAQGAGGLAQDVPAPQAAQAPDGSVRAPSQPQQQQQVEPVQRQIIYSANLSVTVPDVNKAADDATAAARDAGGSVSADQRTLDNDRSIATLTLRVPSTAFTSTVERVAKLGTEVSRSVQSQDVTENLIDVDARIATQRASVDRVRALLAEAKTIGEVVSIESELTRREADLDSLIQRKDKLSGLVALSTITVTLRGPAAPVPPTPSGDEGGFWGGLKSGWHAFLVSAKGVLLVVGWLLPWALVIGIPVWVVLYGRGQLRRRRPSPAPAPLSTLAPAPLAPAPPVGVGVPGPRPAPPAPSEKPAE